MVIDSFSGSHYAFLSNFWECSKPVSVPSDYLDMQITGPTVEHVYQAYKAARLADAAFVLAAGSPGEAKKRGRKVELRPDWEEIKIPVMFQCLQSKFGIGRQERQWLIETSGQHLREGNTWGDTFWGVDSAAGGGLNYLGKLLMVVREQAYNTDVILASMIGTQQLSLDYT